MKICLWCKKKLTAGQARWCSKKHRQAAWRVRKLGVAAAGNDKPRRLAYADPPYPGCSWRYYRGKEVDHKKLIKKLETFDSWALSTSRHALRQVLQLCPSNAIICPWVKTHKEPRAYGPSNIHEYLIVVPGRKRLPGPPDAFYGAVARGGDSDLMGRKPIKFVHWVFQLLGAQAGDSLADLYPGSGIVGRCWKEFSRVAPAPGAVSEALEDVAQDRPDVARGQGRQ